MGRRSGAARGRHGAAAGRARTAPAQPPEGAPVRGPLRRGAWRAAEARRGAWRAGAGPAPSGPQQEVTGYLANFPISVCRYLGCLLILQIPRGRVAFMPGTTGGVAYLDSNT